MGAASSLSARVWTRLGLVMLVIIAALWILGGSAPAASAQHPGATLSLPCIPAGHSAGTIPSISFGRTGGNIRPMQVAIYGDGTISYHGAARPLTTTYTILPSAVLGLQRLAQAEGFASMSSSTKVTPGGSDFATLFITVRAGCSTATHTVRVRGDQSGGFMELYDTLLASVAIPATQGS